MSEIWAGFTDEDIKKIKTNPRVSKVCNIKNCEVDDFTSRYKSLMRIKQASSKHCDDCHEENSLSEEGKMKHMSSNIKSVSTSEDFLHEETKSENNCTNIGRSYDKDETSVIINEKAYSKESTLKNDKDQTGQSNSNLPPLELFEMRQKRIEAENARRRALINKAINDKKMRTEAEAMKLSHITQELNRIDSSLSADVSILRNYIEKASLEFSEAEKRYLKAEKEFVEAKLVLFDKMQRKEMLTQHLCAIIEQNENRKADKLVELMKQLEMESIVEECDINGIEPILPNLCLLNDETYHSCQTLKLSSKQHLQEQTESTEQQYVFKEENIHKSQENIHDNKPAMKTSADNLDIKN